MIFKIITCAAFAVHATLIFFNRKSLAERLQRKEDEAELLQEERLSERKGRTKAEREVRELQLALAQAAPPAANGAASTAVPDLLHVSFPLRPIGILASCFDKRNGTPRQPLLVPAARAALTLRPELSADLFDGLTQYTHCWVLYIFHENTDLQRLWSASYVSPKAKIRVPRLNGGRLGAFATRSPHRPCPIGLSVARVIGIKGRTLILGGADIVDGSPVLDIKPYVPFCDAVESASAPGWVAPTAEDEPLEIEAVRMGEGADAALRAALEESCEKRGGKAKGPPLYEKYEDYRDLVVQVCSRDIRSVTQRVKVPTREREGVGVPALAVGAVNTAVEEEGKWHVELDGVDITYDVLEEREEGDGCGDRGKQVVVKTARCVRGK